LIYHTKYGIRAQDAKRPYRTPFLKKTNKITTMLLIVLNINELGKNILIFKQDHKGGVCGIKGTYIG
jgi:hypothetical protein